LHRARKIDVLMDEPWIPLWDMLDNNEVSRLEAPISKEIGDDLTGGISEILDEGTSLGTTFSKLNFVGAAGNCSNRRN
jgi:hypothetical protein